VSGITDAVAISVGDFHACARKADGSMACWGGDWVGQLGDGRYDNAAQPTIVGGMLGAKDVALGGSHACAVAASGTVACWGDDSSGQLGDGVMATTLPVAPLLTCP